MLSVGVLCARPADGLMSIISDNGTGGVMTRRLLPAAILIPFLLGWARWWAQQQGVFDQVMGLSLFVLTNIVIFHAENRVVRGSDRPRAAVAASRCLLSVWLCRDV
jgi:nitrogen fixation-related uncharacterized protein